MYFGTMIEKREENSMVEEITSFMKLPVYTRTGLYVGHVKNVFIDIDQKEVSSLLLTSTNPSIVERYMDVAVPYRWVNAVGDIVILSHFPERVTLEKKKEEAKTEAAAGPEIEVEKEEIKI